MRPIKLCVAATAAFAATAAAAEEPLRTEGSGPAAAGQIDLVAPHGAGARIAGMLTQQLAACLGSRAEFVDLPAARIYLKLNRDGTLARDPAVIIPEGSGDAQYAGFQVILKRALEAIRTCAPFTLPAEQYDLWKGGFTIRTAKQAKLEEAKTPEESMPQSDLARLIATLKDQLMRCWALPLGTGAPPVRLRFELNQDGTLARKPAVLPVNQGDLQNARFQVAAESAVRAVRTCTPLKLPAARYDAWKEVKIVFDPREMYGSPGGARR